uniref:EGF-like domain-containing protein n=1 Tax=Tetradesmus obliquus TaxID=3088 RepID=A0A383VBU1_TETOB
MNSSGQPVTTRCRSKLVLASLLLWLSWAPFVVAQSKPCSPDERIPKCQDKACVVRRVTGLAEEVAVCNACQPGYSRINRARACACPPGQYDTGNGCAACGFGNYCPGAAIDYVALPAHEEMNSKRGPQNPCDKGTTGGLTTATKTARTWTSCVVKPGFRLASTSGAGVRESTQTAALCEANRFNIGNNRATTCTPCPTGLVTVAVAPAETTSQTARNRDARLDCKIPAGYYYQGSRAAVCPKGSYREGLAETGIEVNCISCNPPGKTGISTEALGATQKSACRVVEAGFAALWDEREGGFAYEATPCPIGTYFTGGSVTEASLCTPCNGYVTRSTQSTSLADCLAPPGYYLDSPDTQPTLQRCPTSITHHDYSSSMSSAYKTFGTYRPGWATTPNGVRDCKACGANMLVMPTEPSEMPEGFAVQSDVLPNDPLAADDTTLVATSAASCYIMPHWGLVRDLSLDASISTWRAFPCPDSTVGTTDMTFGTASATVCRPITVFCGEGYEVGAYGDKCMNPAGFGAYAKAAVECSDGSWAARGSKLPCTECGKGRTTMSEPKAKQSVENCFVQPGFGIYNPEGANPVDKWYDTGASKPVPGSLEDQAKLDVAECPIGRYSSSTGGEAAVADVSARCKSCPPYSTTLESGSISMANCTVCEAGSGRKYYKAYGGCLACERGSFSNGERTNPFTGEERTDWECMQCPRMTFRYEGQDDFTSDSTTLQTGAESDSDCLPVHTQLSSFVGTSVFNTDDAGSYVWGLMGWEGGSLEECVNYCRNTAACHFVEWHYTDTPFSGCWAFRPTPSSAPDAAEVYYKLPPSNDIRAASRISAASADAKPTANATGGSSGSANSTTGRVKARTISSGAYAKYTYDASKQALAPWGRLISSKLVLADAADACDANPSCWGLVKAQGGGYDLWAGSTLAGVRTFINTDKADDTASTSSKRIVQPGRFDKDPCLQNTCSERGTCIPGKGCQCDDGYYNGAEGKCEKEGDDVCFDSEAKPEQGLDGTVTMVYPGTVTMPCLEKLWGTLYQCPNSHYVLNGPQTAAWQNSNLSSVQAEMWSIVGTSAFYLNVDSTNPANIEGAAACLGINRYQAVGDEPTGANAEKLRPISYVRQCPAGTFINKVMYVLGSRRNFAHFWVATCSDGSTLEPIVPGGMIDAPAAVEVSLPAGFDEVTLQGYLHQGVWTGVYGRGFSLQGSRKMPWTGYSEWDLAEGEYLYRTAVAKCLKPGEVAVGWHGSMLYQQWFTVHMDGTVGLICQKRELIDQTKLLAEA